jgi:hypothetical protein
MAYTPTHSEWNGQFREIKVTVRRSGVHLHYRSGYYALPDQPLDTSLREEMIDAAKWSPVNATGIGLTVHARRGDLDGKPHLQLLMDADAKDIHFEEKDGRHITDLVFVSCRRAADGRDVGGSTNLLALRLKEDEYQRVAANGLRVTVTSELDPAEKLVRLILLDGATGRLGSVDVPLTGEHVPTPLPSPAPAPGKP